MAKVARCPRCKRGVLRQQVSIYADAPVMCRNLSKSGIRSRDVKILGVGWDRATYYCTRPGCGYLLHLAKKGD